MNSYKFISRLCHKMRYCGNVYIWGGFASSFCEVNTKLQNNIGVLLNILTHFQKSYGSFWDPENIMAKIKLRVKSLAIYCEGQTG